jgi:hypothetical protein
MKQLKPDKLHIISTDRDITEEANVPRRYTLTHADMLPASYTAGWRTGE